MFKEDLPSQPLPLIFLFFLSFTVLTSVYPSFTTTSWISLTYLKVHASAQLCLLQHTIMHYIKIHRAVQFSLLELPPAPPAES